MSDFDDYETASPILPDDFLYSLEENTPKQPEREENGSQELEKDMTTFDNVDSESLAPLEEEFSETNSGNIENSCQSWWA